MNAQRPADPLSDPDVREAFGRAVEHLEYLEEKFGKEFMLGAAKAMASGALDKLIEIDGLEAAEAYLRDEFRLAEERQAQLTAFLGGAARDDSA